MRCVISGCRRDCHAVVRWGFRPHQGAELCAYHLEIIFDAELIQAQAGRRVWLTVAPFKPAQARDEKGRFAAKPESATHPPADRLPPQLASPQKASPPAKPAA